MDAAIGKLVSERLKLQTVRPHPDPDLLTAFAEHSTTIPERENLLQHLAACSDCRKILYLAMPNAVETQATFASATRRPRLAVRWATLAASVVILGSVLVTNRGIFTQRSSVASVPATAPSVAVPENSPAAVDLDKKAEPARATSQKYRAPLKHMTAKPQAGMQFDASGEVHFAAPHPTMAAEAAKVSSLNLQSPAAAWSLSPGGLAQRSFDSGKSWQTVTVENGLSFKAIKSIGNDVWVGGNSGVLYHSADSGQSWNKVEPSAAGEMLRSDITQIDFSDSQNGALTTGDGHVWSTSDGGQNWRLK